MTRLLFFPSDTLLAHIRHQVGTMDDEYHRRFVSACRYINHKGICKTQGEFDALVDFVFATGHQSLGRSNLLLEIKTGKRTKEEIQRMILSMTRYGNEEIPILKDIRQWEADRYME